MGARSRSWDLARWFCCSFRSAMMALPTPLSPGWAPLYIPQTVCIKSGGAPALPLVHEWQSPKRAGWAGPAMNLCPLRLTQEKLVANMVIASHANATRLRIFHRANMVIAPHVTSTRKNLIDEITNFEKQYPKKWRKTP